MQNRSILTISPVLIGLLAGCATKQTWVPELEDAQKTYAEVSQDPIVTTLAEEDLQSAARQLQRAEDAAASFRKPQTIAHQARLAKLRTLTAQQRARTLSASHGVQLALGQPPLLSEEKIAAATMATQIEDTEPMMGAAVSASDAGLQAQLAALSQQLAMLQAQLSNSPMPVTSVPQAAISADSLEKPVVPDKQMLALMESTVSYDNAAIETVEAPLAPTAIKAAQPYQPLEPEAVLGAALAAPVSEPPQAKPANRQIHRKLRAMNAKPNTRGMSLILGERYFDRGSDRLMRQRSARHLDNVAAVLKQNPELELFIEGHTDNRVGAESSQDLTVNRAIAIKSALVLRGVDADRISTSGFGSTKPIADNSTALGRLQNRRVELIFPLN